MIKLATGAGVVGWGSFQRCATSPAAGNREGMHVSYFCICSLGYSQSTQCNKTKLYEQYINISNKSLLFRQCKIDIKFN